MIGKVVECCQLYQSLHKIMGLHGLLLMDLFEIHVSCIEDIDVDILFLTSQILEVYESLLH